MSILRLYRRGLESHPLKTKMLTSSALFAAAEVLKSCIESRNSQRPPMKSSCLLKAVVLGGCFVAPSLHLWYSRTLPVIFPLPYRMVVKKMIVDQTVFATYFFGLVLGFEHISKGSSINETKNHLVNELPKHMRENWKFWPLVQLFNFKFIPATYQILYFSIIGVFWQAYIKHLKLNSWV